MSTGKLYDLKLGYGCNNNCFHCVIEPQKTDILKESLKANINQTYSQIIECINSKEFSEATDIVITGGEPTIRNEFMRILKYITEKYPEKNITIQTNGRRLKDFIEEIYHMSRKIKFVIALHSMEEKIHNQITSSNNGNSFQETWTSIQEIKRVYKDFSNAARIEIVISSLNIDSLYDTIKGLYENDIKNIGISYPHLDGKYTRNINEAMKIGISYKKLKEKLPYIYNFAKLHPDLHLLYEEIPMCMWRDEKENLFEKLDNIECMDHNYNEDITVIYPNFLERNFINVYKEMHRQSPKCEKCVYCCSCHGIWFEAFEMFGDEDFVPITVEN